MSPEYNGQSEIEKLKQKYPFFEEIIRIAGYGLPPFKVKVEPIDEKILDSETHDRVLKILTPLVENPKGR
jgi:hypothetical protein